MKVLGILALCSLVYMVSGSCFWDYLKDGGCVYKDHSFPVGSNYTDMKGCFRCDCSKFGMSCCGFGHQAGVFSIPDGCAMVKDGCNFDIVDANDHSRPCDIDALFG